MIQKSNRWIPVSLWLMLSFIQPAFADDTGASQEQLDNLKKEIATLTDWMAKASKDASDLQKTLASIEREISATSVDAEAIRKRQKDIAVEQIALKQQKDAAIVQIARQKGQIEKLVLASYKTGETSMFRLILDQNDPLFWRRMLNYSETISATQLALIQEYQRNVQTLSQTEIALVAREQEQKTAGLQLALKQQTLVKQKTDRTQVLHLLNSQMQSTGEKLEQFKADRARLETLLAKMAEAIENLVPSEMLVAFDKAKGGLRWPVKGKVVQRFGATLGNGPLTSQGIVIKAPANTDVMSVHHGRVVFADWLNGFGLLMIVDHGDGYMSLYARNEVLMRSVGDWVNSSDLLAKSGGMGIGDDGLYFEIRHIGKPQNPQIWLSKS